MTLKKLIIAGAAALAVASSVCGCTTMRQPFTMAQVAQLKPGVSTIEEAIYLLGKPVAISDAGSGVLLQWMAGDANPFAAGHHVAILFGPDHKMIKVTYAAQD